MALNILLWGKELATNLFVQTVLKQFQEAQSFEALKFPKGILAFVSGMTSPSFRQDIEICPCCEGVMTEDSEQGLGMWEEGKAA